MWVKREHPIWGKEEFPGALKDAFPRTQWVLVIKGNERFSIVPPSLVTMNKWELYPVDGDCRRFRTLKEAMYYANKLAKKTCSTAILQGKDA